MKRMLLIVALLLSTSPLAADWRFDGQYYWSGTQAYSVTRKACGCGWNYRKVYPRTNQYSYVNTVGPTTTVTNVYNFAQAAAAGGSTSFGYIGAAYQDLNLAAATSQNARIIEQGYQGLFALGAQHGQNIAGLAVLQSELNRTNQIVATGQAASQIARSVQPDPVNLSVQSQTTIGGQDSAYGGRGGDGRRPFAFRVYQDDSGGVIVEQIEHSGGQGGGGRTPPGDGGQDDRTGRLEAKWGEIAQQHCAVCHAGATPKGGYNLANWPSMSLSDQEKSLVRVQHADPAKRMPLAVDGSPGEPLPEEDVAVLVELIGRYRENGR